MRSIKAYSFLELLIALSIFSLLAIMTIPSLSSFYRQTNSLLLRDQLITTLYSAKKFAKINGLPVSLCHSQDQETCGGEWTKGLLIFIDEKGKGNPQSKDDILWHVAMQAVGGQLFWRDFSSRPFLSFLPEEIAQASNGTFWYCPQPNSSPVWAIVVNQAHRARVVYPNKKGIIKDSRGKTLDC